MKFIRKPAYFVGFIIIRGTRIDEWRCPNKKCGFGVAEDYNYCPYCGQRLKFGARSN